MEDSSPKLLLLLPIGKLKMAVVELNDLSLVLLVLAADGGGQEVDDGVVGSGDSVDDLDDGTDEEVGGALSEVFLFERLALFKRARADSLEGWDMTFSCGSIRGLAVGVSDISVVAGTELFLGRLDPFLLNFVGPDSWFSVVTLGSIVVVVVIILGEQDISEAPSALLVGYMGGFVLVRIGRESWDCWVFLESTGIPGRGVILGPGAKAVNAGKSGVGTRESAVAEDNEFEFFLVRSDFRRARVERFCIKSGSRVRF
ncbi:hypothetical protein AOQ84DRAFT_226905 [Glonium stellatum]|uniref:Uncharacterized protein n=1 Tax=Glonium stellatum TaxID=574774 RepID=A0A8E2JNQ3_9PEZI|nr:hypothetical protein AOQ84DRAFT_226905 [Glonium stellatum]